MQIKTPTVSSSLASTVPWTPSSPRYKLQSSAPTRREKGVEANPTRTSSRLYGRSRPSREASLAGKIEVDEGTSFPIFSSFLASDSSLVSLLLFFFKLRMHSQLRTPLCGVIESIHGKSLYCL